MRGNINRHLAPILAVSPAATQTCRTCRVAIELTRAVRIRTKFFEHCSGLAAWHRTARDRAKETTEGRTATPPAINRAPTGSDLDFD